jgi:hypothetical protein
MNRLPDDLQVYQDSYILVKSRDDKYQLHYVKKPDGVSEPVKINDLKEFLAKIDKAHNNKEENTIFLNFIQISDIIRSNGGHERCKLSEATEKALVGLREMLLPATITPSNYFNINQFLLAACEAYISQFDTFQNWDQRDVYCVRIIGLLQSLVSPELGKIFCESLFDVIEKGRVISQRAANLKFADGSSFYRSGSSSSSGLGFNFLSSFFGGASGRSGGLRAGGARVRSAVCEKLCRANDAELRRLKANLFRPVQQQNDVEPVKSRCVIC